MIHKTDALSVGTIVLLNLITGEEQSFLVQTGSKIATTIEDTEAWPDVILTPAPENLGIKLFTWIHKEFRQSDSLPIAVYVQGTMTFINL